VSFPAVLLPGQRLTGDRFNAAAAIGRLVFFAARDAAQSIADSTVGTTANALSWDNVILDLLGGWSAGSPTRYTPTEAGWYQLTGEAGFAGSASGARRGSSWLVNGALPVAATSVTHANTPTNQTLSVPARNLPTDLDGSSDYVELSPFQNTGGALNTGTGSLRCHIAIYYAGPLS
jgi:hypothetical protein